MKYQDDLLFWIAERERIRVQKEAGIKRPWTHDPVLSTYRFCNVRREDDKVTQWIHNNWLRPNLSSHNLPFAMGVARMVNLPETLAELGFPHSWDDTHFCDVLQARKAKGLKVWTSAYMITGGFSKGGDSKEVIIAKVLNGLFAKLDETTIVPGDTLAEAALKVTSPGIGSFLSAQIVADLKWSPRLRFAKDWHTWCSPGPGSTMGLNFLHDRHELSSISAAQFMKEVNEIRHLLRSAGYDLCAQNTQNCLCEFSKYVRAKHFNRRLKAHYVPA